MNFSRRNFMRASAGSATAGFVLDSILTKPIFAEEGEEDREECQVQPEPIPHTIATPFGTTIHFFFPGPVEGVDPVTGHDPSLITNFRGAIGEVDLAFTGTGTDLSTGDSAPYGFDADVRFMRGKFVAADGRTHRGAFAFI
jgi:hypothetical protein